MATYSRRIQRISVVTIQSLHRLKPLNRVSQSSWQHLLRTLGSQVQIRARRTIIVTKPMEGAAANMQYI